MAAVCSTASLLFLASAAWASIGPVTDLTVGNMIFAPDGYPRDTVVVNQQFPAPLIVGNQGDEFQLNVHDNLEDTDLDTVTSIHWHGLFQHGTPHADGPSFVTQCPLIPGESFLYQFSVPDQAGTYWYHSHYSNQYCDGLRGPLVIYNPNDPNADLYDVDNEDTVITLADWYHYLSTDAPPGAPHPVTTLINGKGRTAPANGEALNKTEIAVVNVQAGQRYRFRVVSISCDTHFNFSIDGHTFKVIEVDGQDHVPLVITQVEIFAGQRYSLVMKADQPVDNYWIRADGPISNGTDDSQGVSKAILRYAGAPVEDPTSKPAPKSLILNEQDLHPLDNPPAPDSDDVMRIPLNVSFTGGIFAINGVPFDSPKVPVLLQILSGQPADKLMPNGSVYTIPKGKVIELDIRNEQSAVGSGPHPIHLHGHAFSVVKSSGNATLNYVNPPRRDVVALSDSVVIRFVTDNPGPWFLHCHIDWHLTAGFAAVFAEDVEDIPTVDQPPQAWDQLCPAYDSFMGNYTSNSHANGNRFASGTPHHT